MNLLVLFIATMFLGGNLPVKNKQERLDTFRSHLGKIQRLHMIPRFALAGRFLRIQLENREPSHVFSVLGETPANVRVLHNFRGSSQKDFVLKSTDFTIARFSAERAIFASGRLT